MEVKEDFKYTNGECHFFKKYKNSDFLKFTNLIFLEFFLNILNMWYSKNLFNANKMRKSQFKILNENLKNWNSFSKIRMKIFF